MLKISLYLFLFSLTVPIFLFFFSSCRLYRLERNLNPVNAEFLSKVRYIITGKERKIFLELPDSEKKAFRENFWEIRDPDPDTEENEFKMEYFNRIETANGLFVSEGRPGWLTDRGRIYILFGPPYERMTYVMGSASGDRNREIWYYGNFPIVFIDYENTGQYKLVTYDLTRLRSLNLNYLHAISKAQDQALGVPEEAKDFFDFNWRIKKGTIAEDRIESTIEIDIPYNVIWLNAEDDLWKAVLDVRLELKDAGNNIIWQYEDAFEIAFREEEISQMKGKKYKIEIPLILDQNLARLCQGKNILYAVVRNRSGDEEAKKAMEFRLLKEAAKIL
jgi:GWxTD domain-containing protein